MIRTACSILTGAGLVTGCLFPSFDGTQAGETSGGIAPRANEDVVATGDASTSTSTSTSSTGASSSDGGSEAGAKAGIVACENGIECSILSGNACCATVGGPKCQDSMSLGFCKNVELGSILRCDDEGDCGANQVCCLDTNQSEATCTATCAGMTLCTTDHPKCPTGKSCTGVFTHGGGFTSSFCQ